MPRGPRAAQRFVRLPSAETQPETEPLIGTWSQLDQLGLSVPQPVTTIHTSRAETTFPFVSAHRYTTNKELALGGMASVEPSNRADLPLAQWAPISNECVNTVVSLIANQQKNHSQENLLGPNQQALVIKARATRRDQLLDWSGLNVCDYDDVAEPCVCTSRLGSRGDECA